MGEFPSGQRGQTVNLLSVTSVVRIHLPPPRKTVAPAGVTVFLFVRRIRRGAEVNDAPAAHQSRGTACPQAGESTFPHQERAGEDQLVLFIPPRKNIEQALARRPDIVFLSIFSCVRLPCGAAHFLFSRVGHGRRAGTGGHRRGQADGGGSGAAFRGALQSIKFLSAKSSYHKFLVMSRIFLQESC